MSEFNKDWNQSKSLNNGGTVPFYRPIDLTEEEKAQARKNIGVTGSPDITNLENKVDNLDGNVASMSAVITAVDSQFGALSAAADEAVASANAALTSIGAYSANLNTVSSNVNTVSGEVNSVRTNVSTISGNLNNVSSKSVINENNISTISGNVNGLTNSMNTVSAVVDSNNTAISSLSGKEAQDRTDINNISGNLANVSNSAISGITMAAEAKNTANATSALLDTKQHKLSAGQNVDITSAYIIDIKNDNCSAVSLGAIAIGSETYSNGMFSFTQGHATSAAGAGAHAEGEMCYAKGNLSHAEGFMTSAYKNGSHSEGVSGLASGMGAHVEGYGNSSIGYYTHAEGLSCLANTDGAHAEGLRTTANYTACHSEGRLTYAYKEASHAEGYGSSAVGHASHAEGYYCLANHTQSHAEGDVTSAYGRVSHTEGSGCSTQADGSHAEGLYTIANRVGQHVEGWYNEPNSAAITIIGNGTSTADRSNIVETYVDHVVVNGNLNVSGTDYIDMYDTVNRFMFDNAQIPSGSKTCVLKLNTNDWICTTSAYTNYNKKYNNIMSGENFNTTRNAGYTYPLTVVCGLRTKNNGYVGITEWKGDISKIAWNGTSGTYKNRVSAWPNKLPDDYGNISTYERMFSENLYVTTPDILPVDFLEKTSAASVGVPRCFAGCTNITGNWDAYVQAYSAKTSARNILVFSGCTGMDNYSTYTANPDTSGMFRQ